MRKRTHSLWVVLAIAVGCGTDVVSVQSVTPFAPDTAGFCTLPLDQVEARIDALLPQMTLEEKVDQMTGSGAVAVNGLWPTPDNPRRGIPGFRMVDGPRGVSQATGHATAFPVGMARGATWNPSLEERVGDTIAIETRAKGANVLLAPTLNVLRHPRWGRAQETYGEDPLAIGRMGAAFIRGAQRHLIASAKHFALNSIEDMRHFVNVSADERTLREIYLPHFRIAVQEAHVASVMSAYNSVNGQFCSENMHLLRTILKDEWGFQGFVESDWGLAVRSTAPSARAGLDIEMPVAIHYGSALVRAVATGAVPEATIDDAVRRILRTKFCYELDTKPPVLDPSRVETREHTALAREVARQAIVLLKNADGALPLDRAQVQSLAVVGRLADTDNIGDEGSSWVIPSYVVTPLEGIRAAAGGMPVTFAGALPLSSGDRDAIAAAGAAVVVVGLPNADEREALDRKTLRLSAAQEQLIADVAALQPRTIVVLEGGAAIDVEPWVDSVAAVLMAWYPGQEGGTALAEILFGDVNPTGKLPIVFARSDADLPPFDNLSREVTYGYYHGYRLLDRNGAVARFPFGFGLSYTTYRYSNLALAASELGPDDVLQVSLDVTNTGDRAGDEIVQAYVGADGSRVDRPVKDLKGFARVSLAAGETRRVRIVVPVRDLAFYDVEAGAWEVEPIAYTAYVGPSSADLPLRAGFSVRGAPHAP